MKYRKLEMLAAAVLSAAVFVCSSCSAPENEDGVYRVKKIKGVPLICENGKPVRGRMFYGATNGVKFKVVDPEWTRVAVDFSAPENGGNLRLKISFDALVKSMAVRKISLVNAADNSAATVLDPASPDALKSVSTTDKKRGKISLESGAVLLEKDTAKDSASVGFLANLPPALAKGAKYRLEAEIKCDKRGWIDFVVFGAQGIAGRSSEPTFLGQVKLAAQSGVDFLTFGLPVEWNWDEPGKAESLKKYFDKIFSEVLAANPNAKIIPRLGANAPAWWLDRHPDLLMRNSDGTLTTRTSRGNYTFVQKFASISSREFREASKNNMRRTIEFLEEHYGKHIAGYHPGGASTGEWLYEQPQAGALAGYDAATLAAWREWLSKKYGTAEALQKAWGKSGVSPETAEVPTYEERACATGQIIDPAALQNVADFNLFLNEEMAGIAIEFGKVVREATRGKKLSLAFYGYAFELAGTPAPALKGHYAFRKVLESPYIDIVCAPISYLNRGKGGVKNSMGAVESCMLAEKVWLDEDDNRTYLTRNSGSILLNYDPKQQTQKDSIDVMRRNLAQEIIRNTPSWWMDLFGTGWYEDAEIWKQIELTKKAETDMLARPHFFEPQVGLVYDEASVCYMGKNSHRTLAPLMIATFKNMHYTAIPFGQYMLEDILEARANPKLNIFLNAVALSKEQREKMRAAAERSSCIYTWATGYADTTARKLSLEAVEEATGFKVKLLKG
ncbi:MAG: beta-galactosidase, partial [Opitutales bacterium]|nr:beta-galactosidase [Opitutales bacterium]